jgi:hypothetical protein
VHRWHNFKRTLIKYGDNNIRKMLEKNHYRIRI